MRIIRCDDSNRERWNAYVQSSPQASFYHRAEWQAINRTNFGHECAYLAAVVDDAVVGVFPIVRLKSAVFGNIACSMPFVNYGGPCAATPKIEAALLDEAAAMIAQWKSSYLEIRSRRHLGPAFACSEHKVSMTLTLNADPEVVWNAFNRNHRAEVRRAGKHGFTAKFGADLIDDFYEVLSESWRDMGTPIYRKEYLRSILDTFGNATRLCVVYAEDGTPAAGAMDGIHNSVVEGMWLGMRSQYRKQLVGYVLYWELIKHACENGFRRFHLGRSSKDSGAEQFKKKWNAETDQLYWNYLLRDRKEIPSLNPSNPKYRLAIKVWQSLPVPLTQLVGPVLARSIP